MPIAKRSFSLMARTTRRPRWITIRCTASVWWIDAKGGLGHGDERDVKIRRQIRECVLFIPIGRKLCVPGRVSRLLSLETKVGGSTDQAAPLGSGRISWLSVARQTFLHNSAWYGKRNELQRRGRRCHLQVRNPVGFV